MSFSGAQKTVEMSMMAFIRYILPCAMVVEGIAQVRLKGEFCKCFGRYCKIFLLVSYFILVESHLQIIIFVYHGEML